MEEWTLLPPNFRDLGGMKGADGRTVRPRRLLRAGELVNLPPEGQKLLRERYGLRTIVDFRGKREIAHSPDTVPEGVRYVNLDLAENLPPSAVTGLEEILNVPDVEIIHAMMESVYRDIVKDPVACTRLRVFLDILLGQEEGAVLFHCYAGKDRTGLAAAVILTLLGVSEEDILADYYRTNELRKPHNQPIIDMFARQGATETQLAIVAAALQVEKRYLLGSFDSAREAYGSFMGFLRQGLGVTEQEQARLRELYLE